MSLEELVEKAKELNDASDLLNQQIKAIDAALQKLNIGLVCWESVNDYLNIGYWNNGKRWGIAIYHRGHTAQKEAFWLFDEAPRAYRVKVIEYIPNLIEALIRVSNAMVLRLKQKADIANKFVEIMEEVNSERGKKNV